MDWILTGVPRNCSPDNNELFDIEISNLLNGFKQLSIGDREEFLGILDLKLKLAKKNSIFHS